jgi:hypothetical protein
MPDGHVENARLMSDDAAFLLANSTLALIAIPYRRMGQLY